MQTGMLMHTLRSFMVWSLQHCVLAREVHQQRSCAKTQCSNDQTMKDLRVCISMPVHVMAGTTESEPTLRHLAAMTSGASIDVLNAATYRNWAKFRLAVNICGVWRTGFNWQCIGPCRLSVHAVKVMLKSAKGQQQGQWTEPT